MKEQQRIRQALISDEMLAANSMMHQDKGGYGGSGWRHAPIVWEYAKQLEARTILDYGCGERTLRRQLRRDGYSGAIKEYDPAIPKLAALPKPADLVVSTDVLEHIEPDLLTNVLDHICDLSIKGSYLVIATRLANKKLPDGRNAHLIVESAEWWIDRVTEGRKWSPLFWRIKPNHEVRLWLAK